jgi:hypothetical protein
MSAAIPDAGLALAVVACGGACGICPARPGIAEITTAAQPARIAVTKLLNLMVLSLEFSIDPATRVCLSNAAQSRRRRWIRGCLGQLTGSVSADVEGD